MHILESELNWKKNISTKSSWRGDCDIALLKLFLYKKILGFNDKDDSLSDLIRDGQITRENALHKLEDEHYISDSYIKTIIEKNGVNYSNFESKIMDIRSSL